MVTAQRTASVVKKDLYARLANLIIRYNIREHLVLKSVLLIPQFLTFRWLGFDSTFENSTMYTIISGTNRIGSHTEKMAAEYYRLLKEKSIDAVVFSLKDLDVLHRTKEFLKIENEILFPTQKFIFIIPEYNGSFPGVLKAMIDTSDISNAWHYKKALLTGVSSGRAGNLRGMDHLSDCLHYLKMNVHYNKLPISAIDKVIDKNGRLNDATIKVVNDQLNEFLNF